MLRLGMFGLMIGSMVVLAGCSQVENTARKLKRDNQTFDGQRFRASASSSREDPHRFVATVREPSKSVDGAIEAGVYQATKYCITTYGTSNIDWTVGPDTPQAQLIDGSGILTLTGRCREF